MLYDDKKFIGSVLKQARVKQGLSQGALAEKIGLSEKHISNIERGHNYPALDPFFKLCEEFSLNISDFGVNVKSNIDTDKEHLLQKIYIANNNEVKAYNSILLAIQTLLKK